MAIHFSNSVTRSLPSDVLRDMLHIITMGDANTTLQVIEYLSKKGYTKTEATLRAESANHDVEGRPITSKTEDIGGVKYRQGFGELGHR